MPDDLIDGGRPALAMTKSMHVLNEINAMGVVGYARLIDTASPEELTQILAALDLLQAQVERVKRTP